MKNLSIIIPHRFTDSRRLEIFNWIHERYERLYPDSPIIIADSDEDKPFSRSQARNYAVDNADTEFILLADADTMSFRPFVKSAIEMIEKGTPWVIPYGISGYYNLRKPYTDKVMAMKPDAFIAPDAFEWKHQLESWAGQIVMSKGAFEQVNGYDERFIGWGYEDNAFQRAMDTIVGPFKRIEAGWTAHLWHAEPGSDRWAQPHFADNRVRMTAYLDSAGNREAMLETVKGNRGISDI